MIRKILFMSQNDAIQLKPSDKSALISIRVPKGFVPLQYGWKYLHTPEFHDEVEDPDGVWKLFNDEMAIDTISFVKGLPENVETLYIHCHAGISRSAAMAKFFSEMFHLPFDEHYHLYNKLVHRVLWRVYFSDTF